MYLNLIGVSVDRLSMRPIDWFIATHKMTPHVHHTVASRGGGLLEASKRPGVYTIGASIDIGQPPVNALVGLVSQGGTVELLGRVTGEESRLHSVHRRLSQKQHPSLLDAALDQPFEEMPVGGRLHLSVTEQPKFCLAKIAEEVVGSGPYFSTSLQQYVIGKRPAATRMVRTTNPYRNDQLVAPVSGVYQLIDTNLALPEHLKTALGKLLPAIGGGSGFTVEQPDLRPRMAYGGELVAIHAYRTGQNRMAVLEFKNSYFIPESVVERDQRSRILGHRDFPSRESPEYYRPQPDTDLVHYIVLFGPKVTMSHAGHPIDGTVRVSGEKWIDRAEELFRLSTDSELYFLWNRPIRFTAGPARRSFEQGMVVGQFL